MDKPETVKQYRRYFKELGIDPLIIKEQYGDLRRHSTWAQAYSDIPEYNELPIIKAIRELFPDVEQPENFVPPAPPTIPPTPLITQPLLPPAKEYPALPLAREPQVQPGGDGRDNLELQRLPYQHTQLLLAVIIGAAILPDRPFVSDESAVLIDKAVTEVTFKVWRNEKCFVKRKHTCLLGTPIILSEKPKRRGPKSRISNATRPPPFKTMNKHTRQKIIIFLAKQPPLELSFTPLELFMLVEKLLQACAVTKTFDQTVKFFANKAICNLGKRYPEIANRHLQNKN